MIQIRRLWGLALAASSAWLVACGGGGSDGSGALRPSATAADNFFPLEANSRRIYSTSAGSEPVVSRVVGTQAVGEATGTVVHTVGPSDGSDDRTVYVVDANGVREYAAAGADLLERAFDGVEIMRWPAKVGDSFVQIDKTIDSGQDYDGDGRSDRITVRSELTVVARESVVTPAGTFADSLHQRQISRATILPSGGSPAVAIDITIDTWYAMNVGLVKTVRTVGAIGPTGASTISETLSAYRVGSRTSDTVAPTVASVTPGSLPTRGATTSVSAVFSEDMDPDSFVPGSFTVVDSANARIAGTAQVQGRAVRFVSAQTWASGSYTATITTSAQDLVGNSLAASRSWSFTVDATAPGIVASTPADSAVEVALSSPIVLQFSEPPDRATVTTSNITLLDGSTPVPFLLSVDGSIVTVTPTGGLQRAKPYQLYVSNVTDTLGNPMTQSYLLQFRTTQGRFAYPTTLFPGWSVSAMAIGDINGDGVADVVAVGETNMVVSERGLLVRAGRVDGSLGELVRVDVGSMVSCSLTSVAIGDLNADGRPDIIVGSNFCGAQVLHQTSVGTLVLGEFMNRAASDGLRIADVDGDGHLDVVARGGGSGGAVEIWRQDLTGTLVLSARPDTQGAYVKDVEVGDVNGDGRPDLVAAISGIFGQDVAVLLQRPDGSYASPVFLATGSPWGATAVALGDLNGDGRVDIVATTGGNSPTSLAVFYQAAGSAFGPATPVSTYDAPLAVRIADIDGDGRADVIVSHQGWNAVGVYLQQAGGTLAPEIRFAAPYGNFNLQSMAVGDLNVDGRPDIVIAGEFLRQQTSMIGSLRLLPGRALGVPVPVDLLWQRRRHAESATR